MVSFLQFDFSISSDFSMLLILQEAANVEKNPANKKLHEIHNNTSSDELDTNKENSLMIIDEPVGQEEAPNSQLLVDCEDKIELEEMEGEEAELLVMVQDPPVQVEFSDQNDNVLMYRWLKLFCLDST